MQTLIVCILYNCDNSCRNIFQGQNFNNTCEWQAYYSILDYQCLLQSADTLPSFLAAQRLLREGLASYTTLLPMLQGDQLATSIVS